MSLFLSPLKFIGVIKKDEEDEMSKAENGDGPPPATPTTGTAGASGWAAVRGASSPRTVEKARADEMKMEFMGMVQVMHDLPPPVAAPPFTRATRVHCCRHCKRRTTG